MTCEIYFGKLLFISEQLLNYCSKWYFTSCWILHVDSFPSVSSFLSLKWCHHLLMMNTNWLSNASYCTCWVVKLLQLILSDLSVLKKKKNLSLSCWSLHQLNCEVTNQTLDGSVCKVYVIKLLWTQQLAALSPSRQLLKNHTKHTFFFLVWKHKKDL